MIISTLFRTQCVSVPLNEVEFKFSFRAGDNMDVNKTVRRIAIFGEE
jgi:hypothetical protein